jgi:outer membrane protein OmpA-like peptidoglycan-associated protein
VDSTDDRYASAKATLRDNVKWLATSFAAMAAVLLAGTPFTGFGSLPLLSLRFCFAAVGLVGAAGSSFIVWRILLTMLRPDATYTRYLKAENDPNADESLTAQDKLEYAALKAEFEIRKKELLPANTNTLDELEKVVDDAWDAYGGAPGDTREKEDWLEYRANLREVREWAAFTRLHQRVTRGLRVVQAWGVAILFLLTVFAWTVNPAPSSDKNSAATTVVLDQRSSRHPARSDVSSDVHLLPVLFELGKSSLTVGGLDSIGRARDYLRSNPEAGLLILAHTDTLGRPHLNATLAAERASTVRNALVEQGGIAPTRVYIAALPKTDLPAVTADEVPLADNRAVQFLIFQMPPR